MGGDVHSVIVASCYRCITAALNGNEKNAKVHGDACAHHGDDAPMTVFAPLRVLPTILEA